MRSFYIRYDYQVNKLNFLMKSKEFFSYVRTLFNKMKSILLFFKKKKDETKFENCSASRLRSPITSRERQPSLAIILSYLTKTR